jgi:hypothetical protein
MAAVCLACPASASAGMLCAVVLTLVGVGGVSPVGAATTVTGAQEIDAPLFIDPSSDPTDASTSEVSITSARPVAFVQRMPVTKTVSRITLGDLASGLSCASPAALRLHVYEHRAGEIGNATQIAYTTAFENAPATPSKITWTVPPTTLKRGLGYSFRVSSARQAAGPGVSRPGGATSQPSMAARRAAMSVRPRSLPAMAFSGGCGMSRATRIGRARVPPTPPHGRGAPTCRRAGS